MLNQEFILNGAGHGPLASTLTATGDAGLLRPFVETTPNHPHRGQVAVIINKGMRFNAKTGKDEPYKTQVTTRFLQNRGIHSPVFNAATLRKEEWIQLDSVILRAARYRLRAWADLAAANSFGGFNGMSKIVLEHEMMSDPGEAIVDMDGISDVRTDTPLFQLQGIPLPITQSGFWYSARRLAVSRNSGTPLDTVMGEAAGRRVAEAIEKTTIGNQTGMAYGGTGINYASPYNYQYTSQVYGYTSFPNRITTSTFRKPNSANWTPLMTVQDVLLALQYLRGHKFYGPFMIYHSNDWDAYLDQDYIVVGGGTGSTSGVTTQTLRDRLRMIGDIADVRRLDFLFASTAAWSSTNLYGIAPGPGGADINQGYPFTMIFVQMTPDVVQAINGMDITTIQWETLGGMQINFKVMAIQVPRLRSDYYENCGILHATATVVP